MAYTNKSLGLASPILLVLVLCPPPSGAAPTDGDAADELMKALRRKEPQVLDILVECLEDQEEANREVIKRIRAGALRAAGGPGCSTAAAVCGGLGCWGAMGVRVPVSLLCSVPRAVWPTSLPPSPPNGYQQRPDGQWGVACPASPLQPAPP